MKKVAVLLFALMALGAWTPVSGRIAAASITTSYQSLLAVPAGVHEVTLINGTDTDMIFSTAETPGSGEDFLLPAGKGYVFELYSVRYGASTIYVKYDTDPSSGSVQASYLKRN